MMASDTMLYAWARPLEIDPRLDHTWVTDYQPASSYADIQAVVKANKNYWFCWGDFHTNNYRAIGDGGAKAQLAKCLVTPNDPKAHGTIFRYAIDGVCHQLANQVLYSTQAQLVVSKANGYGISSFLYGPYGLKHTEWVAQIHACTSLGTRLMDDIDKIVTQALGDRATPDTVEALRDLRAEFQRSVQDLGQQSFVTSTEGGTKGINDKVSHFMQEAHKILGDEGFKAVFETEYADDFKLVDPDMFAASEKQYAEHLKMIKEHIKPKVEDLKSHNED